MIENFEILAKAISDPGRLRILKMLEAGEVCVCKITAVLGLAPATISKHLALLKNAGLVRPRRDGKWIHYRLADPPPPSQASCFLALTRNSLNDDPVIVGDRIRLTAPPAPIIPDPCA